MGLEGVKAAVHHGAEEAVKEACAEIRETARALCPAETGELRASIASRTEGAAGTVTAGAKHAAYVELGTWKQQARPFLYPAFAMKKAEIVQNVARLIRAAL